MPQRNCARRPGRTLYRPGCRPRRRSQGRCGNACHPNTGFAAPRLRQPSPCRNCQPSPCRNCQPSPCRLRQPSPCRDSQPSPCRLRQPSPCQAHRQALRPCRPRPGWHR
ncbi:MAG: hypothetical protein JO142_02120 [Burkholderiales bacterium]|nr:hypothetical protein [Burkholderiales bacterium]